MADVQVTLTVPDQHVATVKTAYTNLAGRNIRMQYDGGNGSWTYSYAAQGGGESNVDFVKRAVIAGIKATVRMYDYSEDVDRYKTDVAAVDPAAEDVAEGIVI